jgi:poly [ADP-ribose] polymerase 7/11/12/13
MNLFHGTNIKNLNSILKSNFNWRLFGTKVGNKFGKGISFSRFANFSKQYCDKDPYGDNVMILSRVLIGNGSIGESETVLPAVTCDNTVSENEKVWVKYDDHEFYPEYVIHFRY